MFQYIGESLILFVLCIPTTNVLYSDSSLVLPNLVHVLDKSLGCLYTSTSLYTFGYYSGRRTFERGDNEMFMVFED